ncbi:MULTISPECIES: hypothetical protein [Streptomyces violaceusniger group]|uniref:hypothetical protein n=1 Tax=Streptomyces violaceusniger group TaxID=2839105 RepID=UPI001180B40D|nr:MULTISPECIES: hypothetical protein [Streptomyces violaceusniger group]
MTVGHQLAVLRRQINHPALQPADRFLLAALSRMLPQTRWNTFMVTPATLLCVLTCGEPLLARSRTP